MALPSSPPSLLPTEAMEEIPSSPPLLPATSILPSRKRHWTEPEDENSLSSDPLFSEDNSGVEDLASYDRPKRKKMVRGPWYNVGSAKKGAQSGLRQDAFRNVDSGVWMGSDGSIDSMLSSQNRMRKLAGQDEVEEKQVMLGGAEQMANDIVQRCVETGKESVDLSELGLRAISPATLQPLHQLIRPSHINSTEPPSEDEFSALTPSIKLFLARNALISLPPELFNLENITVLSLRNNELTEIPPCSDRLHKLRELNIGGNNIQYLPWELFHLFDCNGNHNQVTVRPNPLLEPTSITGPSPLAALPKPAVSYGELSRYGDTRTYFQELREAYLQDGPLDLRSELELRLKLGRALRIQALQELSRAGKEVSVCREELIYLASSRVHYFSVDGTPMRRLNREDEDFQAVIDDRQPSPGPISTTPSLFETALRTVQKVYYLDDLPSTMPASVKAALGRAAQGLEVGNRSCSTCDRSFIIPRAEWVEYWHNGLPSQTELTQEAVLPFKRTACSWECAVPSEPGEFRC
ncbi:hypothetical protein CLAFUW4_10255 [Fulvia fulva]|uniref:Uncharacterized protein n=1 Tax=Passalora fulva TaxID=5499 RepID=A0A9Q8LF76_PASFU|nr:uncharacterized protein CLAFUR5_04870 [Fulvia fulva]KAK4615420.1 hypothetical protein CLAFUR4_10259 [Fulvia fulva]KAK4617263.1 hypothetical protein CLAFUR0_10257 [Fulvia fulva]UJO16294.1 hypothetical protein CLAFUR5_04870 [Fulvia fulva]WPV19407.1 hypothetical protein CLAFUW4_10255 [Fulvia fulva]WPV34693.1 hypothetical protein CLAFUW7_10255 [Fulvia fulva]